MFYAIQKLCHIGTTNKKWTDPTSRLSLPNILNPNMIEYNEMNNPKKWKVACIREKNHFLKCEPILAVTFVTFVTRSEMLDNQRHLQTVARYIVLQKRPNVTKNAHFQVKTGTKATLLV